MWNSVLVLFLSIAGTLARIDLFCDKNECDSSPLFQGLAGIIPNEEELKTLCIPLLLRLKCHSQAVKDCTGEDLQELASSDNSSVANHANLMLNIESVFVDLCNEDSILHAGYVSNEACFNDKMDKPREKCVKESIATYDAFRESMKLLEVEMSDSETKDADCLITAYSTACFSLELQDKCGEIARATYVEILRRINFLSYGIGTCSQDQISMLRSEYLEFLEFKEEKKTLFLEVFNTRK